MILPERMPLSDRKFWPTLAMSLILAVAFGAYVYSEKQIDRANDLRLHSYLLADQLRQSSDDLTRMARTYVVTGDPVYKKYYQDILDIRDGKKARPEGYLHAYWDMVLADAPSPRADSGQAVPLLELMRQAGFAEEELRKLAEAKSNSDGLTAIEFEAMKLVESVGLDAQSKRIKAQLMMHDARYHRAKADIMQPINASFRLMDKRTADLVRAKERNASTFRIVFIACVLGALFMLWRAFAALRATLGGSADEVHAHLHRIGRGDLSSAITVAPGMQDSVLAGLSVMQNKLQVSEAQHMQAESELRIAATAFESQAGIVVTDPNGVILRINRAFTESTGYTAEEAIGETPRLLKSGHHDAAFYAAMWEAIQRTGTWEGEIWDRRKNGEVYPKWLIITAVKGSDGAVTHYVGTHHDITERKLAEERIEELAFFDPLTRLPNRTLLMDRLKQAMTASARSGTCGAVLFIDLDHFKTLNDTQGHDKGDLLLQSVAQRLAASVREGDTVARLGGDEFVVVLGNLNGNPQEAANQTEVVGEKILAALNGTYRLHDHEYRSSASVGATLFQGQQTSIEDLLKQADLAMYKSKETGRNALRFFDPAMQIKVMARAALEAGLRKAIEGNQLLLHYQAQVVEQGHITGAEALVRWQHPERGIVSPAEFIPLAEETGLILPLGNWVLEAACTQLARWATRTGMAHLTLAVNVSAQQLREADFVDQVLAVISRTGADPNRLKLELTESLLAENVEEIIEKMSALKTRGIGFALDDFGTGYSSLSYLKRLPLDRLKIDQSFVRDVLVDPNDAAIAKTIVSLAQSLGLGVIAEGVETAEQRDFLAGSGCHDYQGYFFSRPLPVEGFEAFVSQA